ncbi:MAG: subtilisin family serine protease [Rhodothermales bacterium]|jgi:subtilisin family serine protease
MTLLSNFRSLTLIAVAATIALTGCSDSLTGANEQVEQTESLAPAEKLRHAHLLDRALRAGPNQVAGKMPNQLGLIFKIKAQSIVERYALLQRYAFFERYALVQRYEYDTAFDGFAVTIEDTTGGTEFTSILSALQLDPAIEWLEPDFSVGIPIAASLDGHVGQKIPWSVSYVGGHMSSAASGDGLGAVDMDIYILDTGATNDDLNIVESIDFSGSLDAGAVDPNDYDGHGTHVAGIIAAKDDDAGLVGIAPGARIHNLKVLGDDGTSDVSVVIAAVEYMIEARMANPNTPMVVNLSLGENIGTSAYTALDEALDMLAGLGVTIVVAAGNQGVNASLVTPAHVASVITVGSHDADGFFNGFSNWGPDVDILAPGDDVVSLSPALGGTGSPVKMSGTSVATPHVAGAAALYLSANPSAGPQEVLAALLSAARGGVKLTAGVTVNKSVYVGNF